MGERVGQDLQRPAQDVLHRAGPAPGHRRRCGRRRLDRGRRATARGRVLRDSRDAVTTLESALASPADVLAFGPAREDRKFA